MEKLENYKFVIYIAIGILYLLFKSRKKEAKEIHVKQTSQVNKGKNIEEAKRSLSSRSLLSKNEPKTIEEKSLPKSINEIDYDENLKDEEQNLTTPKMEEKEKDQHELFVPYSLEEKKENEYAAMLKNPDSLKKVVIMQEILPPKHF